MIEEIKIKKLVYKFSSSLTSIATSLASSNSLTIYTICSWEMITSEAFRAGASTKAKFGSPVSFFNSHKNGFSYW